MGVMDKLKKVSRIKETSTLNKSIFYKDKTSTMTDVPMINVALSGTVDGGVSSGLLTLAGPSRHFKTSFALLMGAAFLKSDPEAILVFCDSEFGSPEDYFLAYGIDTSRVLHIPVTNVEELKFEMMNQLNEIERSDKVMFIIDSIGNLASKKEVEDALSEKSVADMTRAKALKGLFRMITPILTVKDIPVIAINHTYKEIGLFPKDIVSGGTGIMYSSDNVWIIGRQQDKDATGLKGYHFIINIEKSRFVKEKSKIPISVSFDGGIMKYSGLMDLATEGGFVAKPTKGYFQMVDPNTGELIGNKLREKQTMNAGFWDPLLADTKFTEFLKKTYKLETPTGVSESVDEDDDSDYTRDADRMSDERVVPGP